MKLYKLRGASVVEHRAPLTNRKLRCDMAKREIPPPEMLRQLIDYDPESGVMVWRSRRPEHFSDGGHTAEHNCAAWNAKNSGQRADRLGHSHGYRTVRVFNRSYLAHRVAWALLTGAWPVKEIDHKNGCRDDNRGGNLRDVDRRTNVRNTRKARCGVTGVVGVLPRNGRWIAVINRKHIGTFDSIEEAAEARKSAERRLGFGVAFGSAPQRYGPVSR